MGWRCVPLFYLSALLFVVLTKRLGGLTLIALAVIPVRLGAGGSQLTMFEIAIPILALIEHRWHLAPLNARDAAAADLSDAFEVRR